MVTLTKQIVPISDIHLRQGETLEKIKHGPVYLAQRSNPVAVLVAAEQWDLTMERLEMLERERAEQEFTRQHAEIGAGNCPPAMNYEAFQAFVREVEHETSTQS